MDLPQLIGLCPEHGEEFYVPHPGPCPVVGCEHQLREYVPADVEWTEMVRYYSEKISELEARAA